MNAPATTFRSALGPVIAAYLELHCALGRKFRNEAWVLGRLDRFLADRRADALTADQFAAWARADAHLAAATRRQRMLVVRKFCLYQRRTDPRCFVPDTQGFPRHDSTPRPFIFTERQVLALLRAAAQLPATRESPQRPAVYRLAIVLLYTTGLRRGELVRLALADCDLTRGTLQVRASKFRKSRLVALSADARYELERYLEQRLRDRPEPTAPLLAHGPGMRRAYTGSGLNCGVRQLFRAADIRTAGGAVPRIHDLRHTYATHALLREYRCGRDPQALLPRLSIAMGHASPAFTAHYLTCLEPVLAVAAEQVGAQLRPLLGSVPGGSHA